MIIFHSHFYDQLIAVDDAEEGAGLELDGFDLEDMFQACNRIESPMMDIENLSHDWQRGFRALIDAQGVPSMSSGDAVVVTSVSGTVLIAQKCEPVGWSELPPAEAAALVHRARTLMDEARAKRGATWN